MDGKELEIPTEIIEGDVIAEDIKWHQDVSRVLSPQSVVSLRVSCAIGKKMPFQCPLLRKKKTLVTSLGAFENLPRYGLKDLTVLSLKISIRRTLLITYMTSWQHAAVRF